MKHQRNANSARKPSPKGHRIQRRSVSERRRLLARYERSGLTQRAFCLRHGVALSTLQYWRRRARDTDQEHTPTFVEIPHVTGTAGVRSVEAAVFIELPGGVRLEVPAGTDAQWLSGLVRSMGRV